MLLLATHFTESDYMYNWNYGTRHGKAVQVTLPDFLVPYRLVVYSAP